MGYDVTARRTGPILHCVLQVRQTGADGVRQTADGVRCSAVKDAGGRQRLSGADRFNDAVIALKQRSSLTRLLNLWKASSEGV
jgi:hypothetical protein